MSSFYSSISYSVDCDPIEQARRLQAFSALHTLHQNSAKVMANWFHQPGCEIPSYYPDQPKLSDYCRSQEPEIGNYASHCVDPMSAQSPRNEESLFMRREMMKFAFKRELSLLTRLSPVTPGYEERWRDFADRWKKKAKAAPEVMEFDQSQKISELDRGSLKSMIESTPLRKQASDDYYPALYRRTGIAKPEIFDLVKMAVILSFLESKSASQQLGAAERAEEKKQVYLFWPELEESAELKSRMSVLLQESGLNRIAQDPYFPILASDGKSLRPYDEQIDRLNQTLVNALGKNDRFNLELSKLEESFLHGFDRLQKDLDQIIDEQSQDSSLLYHDQIVLLSTLPSINRQSNRRLTNIFTARLCANILHGVKDKQNWSKFNMANLGLTAGGSVLAAAGSFFAWPVVVPAATAGVLGSAFFMTAADVKAKLDASHLANQDFKLGFASVHEKRDSDHNRNLSFVWAAINTGSVLIPGSAVGRLTQLKNVAAATGNESRELQLENSLRAMTAANAGIFVGSAGVGVSCANFFGLGAKTDSLSPGLREKICPR